jgi:ParB-like chromosome segregation protein Spo0J
MKRHDLSGLFGDMPKDDFAKLTDDIKRHGLQHPIVTWQGDILDGWHRFKACKAAGVEPEFTLFAGDDKKALRFVMQENALRRHLNEAQRIRISKQVIDWHTHRASVGHNQHAVVGESTDSTSATDLAKVAGVGRASVIRHNAIEQKAPALLPAVERGDIGLQTAERVANTYDPEVIAKATPAEIKGFAKTLSERPEARCKSLVRAAQELRDQWQALSRMQPTDEILAAFAEVRFVLRGFQGGQ